MHFPEHLRGIKEPSDSGLVQAKGASIEYVRVRTEKGGGGPKIGRFCGRTVCNVYMHADKGRGSKTSRIFADVLNGSPLTTMFIEGAVQRLILWPAGCGHPAGRNQLQGAKLPLPRAAPGVYDDARVSPPKHSPNFNVKSPSVALPQFLKLQLGRSLLVCRGWN